MELIHTSNDRISFFINNIYFKRIAARIIDTKVFCSCPVFIPVKNLFNHSEQIHCKCHKNLNRVDLFETEKRSSLPVDFGKKNL
jgi:hypothetical protein